MSNIHPLRGGEGEGGEEEAAAAELRPVESVPNYVHKLCYVVEVGVTPRQLTYLNATGAPMITEGGWNSFLEHSL